jgi:hypothetical protein
MNNSEETLAAAVVEWLRSQHWDVWQEVSVPFAGQYPTVDIMARNGKALWAVECKMSRSLSVLDQSIWWSSFVNFVSVAVPPVTRRPGCNPKESRAWSHVMGYYGFGEFVVGSLGVDETQHPHLHRNKWRPSLQAIHEMLDSMPQNYGKAGAKETPRWSPFANTRDGLMKIVADQPGISFTEALTKLEHHYASDATARSSIRKWIGVGSIKVDIRRDGRKLLLFPQPAHRGPD